MNRDHCVLNTQTLTLTCHHCGATHKLRDDQREIRALGRAGKAWGVLHGTCPKPKETPR